MYPSKAFHMATHLPNEDVSADFATILGVDNDIGGFIPYGHPDSSVIFRSPLTSEAVVTNPPIGLFASGGGASHKVLAGSGGTFDPALGFKSSDKTANLGAIKIADLASKTALETAGQLSFEVQKDAIASIDGTNHTGRVAAHSGSEDYFLSTGAAGDAIMTNYQRLFAASSATRYMRWPTDASGNHVASSNLSVVEMDDFITVNLSWTGGTLTVALDGMIVHTGTQPNTTDLWKFIYIGTKKEHTSVLNGINHYIRNLQISTKAAAFTTVANVGVSFVGDSLIDFAEPQERASPHSYLESKYQVRGMDTFQARFQNKGQQVTTYSQGVGGDKISHVVARRATILADSPTHIVLQVGTNDAIANTVDTTFDTSIRDEIDAYVANGVQRVFVGTIPSLEGNTVADTGPNETSRQELNAKIRALTDKPEVTVIDIDALLPRGSYLYEDECDDLGADDLHPAAGGHKIMGEQWAIAVDAVI